MAERVLTPTFRIAWPWLFEPRPSKYAPRFEITMLFDKTADLTWFREAFAAESKRNFPAGYPPTAANPVAAGDQHDRLQFPGHNVIQARTAANAAAPAVDGPDLQPITDPGRIYGGCYCNANVSLVAYNAGGNQGVSIYLNAVQFVRDGERFEGAGQSTGFEVIGQPPPAHPPAAAPATGSPDFALPF